MKLSKWHHTTKIYILDPKWHGLKGKGHYELWASKFKVDRDKHGIIEMHVTRAESHKGIYAIDTKKAKKCPVGNNGVIDVYRIPIEDTEPLERIIDPELAYG